MYAATPVHAGMVPPKPRPRVTTTLWEDENTLCFQVEARGISVARREDNDMINGTKLLNVAGMTRGRRDGMLKAEKVRHVVKIGAMHLKGVWIPFDRAAAFAQKEGIADLLYPLFVEDIRSFLYRQQNPSATGDVGLMQGGQDVKGYPTGPQHPQMLPNAGQMPVQSHMGHHQASMMPGPTSGIPGEKGMVRRDDVGGAAGGHQADGQGTGGSADQMGSQHQAYGRQYGYMPQYGMQGYGPMGAYNSAYGSPYASYPMVYSNQDYSQAHQAQAAQQPQQQQQQQQQQPQQQQQQGQPQQVQHAMYYQGQQYQQGYDQSQMYQQAQQQAHHTPQAQQQAAQQAQQQPQAQQHHQQYYQTPQASKPVGDKHGEAKLSG